MMDDIDLQLCLSIDPLPSPRNACGEEGQVSSRPQDQSQALIHLYTKKRPVSMGSFQELPGCFDESGYCVGHDTHPTTSQTVDNPLGGGGDGLGLDGQGAGEGEGDGISEEHNRDHLSIHEFSPGHYLRLPPRKRFRTSFTSLQVPPLRFKGPFRVHDNTGSDRGTELAGRNTDGLESLAVSLPEVEAQNQDQNQDSSALLDSTTELLPTNGLAEMDVDVDAYDHNRDGNDTDASEASTVLMPPPPPSRARPTDVNSNITFHRPDPPPSYAESVDPSLLVYGEPEPAWSKKGEKDDAQAGQPCRFSIYEDPDGMDIDGVGFFETGWYISPEDDKENFEDEENHGQNRNNQTELHDPHGHEPENRHPSSDGPGQDAYHHTVAMRQRAYYPATSTTPARPHTISASDTTPADSQWTSWSAQIPTYFRDSQPGSINTSTLSRNTDTEIPTPAPTPSRPELHNEHDNALPSLTSLSATDLSVRALLHQSPSPISTSTSPSAIHTPNDLEENPRPHRLRRVIRSVNFT